MQMDRDALIRADRNTSSMAASTERKYRYRPHPQVSAGQMAEYLQATSTRRNAIRREARFPTVAVAAQYDGARKGVVKFLDDGARSKAHLAAAVEGLGRRFGRPDATDWMKRDSRYSVEAVEASTRHTTRCHFANWIAGQ